MHVLSLRATHNGGDTPSKTLEQKGPIIQVNLSWSQAAAETCLDEGQIIPQVLSGLALIDTGADQTCIDEEVVEKMQLRPTDKLTVTSFDSEPREELVYPVRLEFVGASISMDIPAIKRPIKKVRPQITALIGRDILKHCLFVYNGITGYLSIAS